MSTNKLPFLAIALALACLAPGCFPGRKADAASARSARAPRAAPPAFDAYSPPDAPPPRPAETFQARASGLPVRPDDFGQPPSALPSDGRDRLAGYSRPGAGDGVVYQDERMTHARLNMNGGPADGREEVLYSAPPAAKPFAGAPVGRSNFTRAGRKPQAPEPESKEKMPWEKDAGLFSAGGAPAREQAPVPNIYANRRPTVEEEETMWPAGTAMVPPAGARAAPLPLMKTEARLPAPAEKRASAPALPPPPPASAPAAAPDGADDEIFSPSMYLGSGR